MSLLAHETFDFIDIEYYLRSDHIFRNKFKTFKGQKSTFDRDKSLSQDIFLVETKVILTN